MSSTNSQVRQIYPIKLFDLSKETIVKVLRSELELDDTKLTLIREYFSIGWDEDKGMEEQEPSYKCYELQVKRSTCVSVLKSYAQDDFWNVEIESYGFPNTIALFFEAEAEADAMRQIISTWVFNQNENI